MERKGQLFHNHGASSRKSS